ncbi:MAG: reverse transcriptase domain-containing protein [Promethearchaeota archaeon]
MCIERICGPHEGDWWSRVNWAKVEREVKRLQGRIYSASKRGDVEGARNLMKLLVRSEMAKLLAIYRVTQRNKGRLTPGIDGKTYLTPEARMKLSQENFNYVRYEIQPALRRYIPKYHQRHHKKTYSKKSRNDKAKQRMRPLGIITIKDRVMMTIISIALEARWEALFEENVMGYRPGRCPQDAIKVIRHELNRGLNWILDADIKGFFDNIKHEAILDRVCCFNDFIKQGLECGIVNQGRKSPTTRGIIQGNPLSPVLANIALHGMESLFDHDKLITIVRFADDFVAIAPSVRDIKENTIPLLQRFLEVRGLSFNREKTRVVSKQHGFDFLGFTIRQPRYKLLVHPRRKKFLEFLRRLRALVWYNMEMKQNLLIGMLNLKIRGWTMYYRYCNSGKHFNVMDSEIREVLWRWAKRKHGKRKQRWSAGKYFDITSGHGWVFRVKKTGYAIKKAAGTKRITYRFTVGNLSPLDPSPVSRKAWKSRRLQPKTPMLEESTYFN